LEPLEAWPHGEVYVLQALWERLGITSFTEQVASDAFSA
jgi:hypothetical protein